MAIKRQRIAHDFDAYFSQPTDSMKIEYWKSLEDRQWYFHIHAKNGHIIAPSEGYTRKTSLLDTLKIFAPCNPKIVQVKG